MGFSRQEYWSGLPFPSPVDHSQTSPPWHVCLGWPHTAWLSFTELDKAAVRLIRSSNFMCRPPRSVPAVVTQKHGGEELPHVWGQGRWHRSGWEELPHVQGQGQRPRGATPCPRSGGCVGTGGPRGATPRSRSGGAAEEIPLVQG